MAERHTQERLRMTAPEVRDMTELSMRMAPMEHVLNNGIADMWEDVRAYAHANGLWAEGETADELAAASEWMMPLVEGAAASDMRPRSRTRQVESAHKVEAAALAILEIACGKLETAKPSSRKEQVQLLDLATFWVATRWGMETVEVSPMVALAAEHDPMPEAGSTEILDAMPADSLYIALPPRHEVEGGDGARYPGAFIQCTADPFRGYRGVVIPLRVETGPGGELKGTSTGGAAVFGIEGEGEPEDAEEAAAAAGLEKIDDLSSFGPEVRCAGLVIKCLERVRTGRAELLPGEGGAPAAIVPRRA